MKIIFETPINLCELHKNNPLFSNEIIDHLKNMSIEDRKIVINQFCNFCFKYDPEFLCKCYIKGL